MQLGAVEQNKVTIKNVWFFSSFKYVRSINRKYSAEANFNMTAMTTQKKKMLSLGIG
jgi:hypothetical protein